MNLDWNDSKILLPKTRDVLDKLANCDILKDFTFIGGSALAFYVQHRQSEDLDFFTWLPSLDKTKIQNTLLSKFNNVHLLTDTPKQQDWLVDGVKVSFFSDDLLALEENRFQLRGNIFIGSIEILAAMKVNTLFLRAKFRDYYDLYALAQKGWAVRRLFENACHFFPNINQKLFQIALIYTDDIEEDSIIHLKPIFKKNKKQISAYFEKALERWLR